MHCPKCGHPRNGKPQCDSCGIIFSKYAEKQRLAQELEYQRLERQEEQRRQLFKKLAGVVAVVFVSGSVFALLQNDEASAPEQVASSTESMTNPYDQYGSNTLLDNDIKKQVSSSTFNIRNSKLSYPRNTSTSFLITRSCYALTDFYISTTPPSSNERIATSNLLAVNNAVAELYDELEAARQKFIAECSDCSQEAFHRSTRRLRDKIANYEKQQEKLNQQTPVETKRQPLSANFNGNSYSLEIVERNEPLGVALLHIESNAACTPVKIGDSSTLKVGDKIFMMGGDGRVADGVVTGFPTSDSGHGLIAHTARASSVGGLLGTPLFNEKGEILGVNVNGIAKERHAVRIEKVLDAFRIVL